MNKQTAMKISIVIPVYKVSAYIADCLRSVCAQTYPHIEVILVNDATPDDSMEQAAPWIQQMQERGYTVQVVNHPENKGLSAARNTGIKATTTEWVYFLDSDDELTPQCIEWMAEQVELHPSVDFVIGGVKVVGADWKYPLTCRVFVDTNQEILQDYTAAKWYVMAWNHLYRKSYLLQHELFFREGLLHEDELYSFQVATTARAMATVYEDTYVYKIRSAGSITSQRKLKNFEDMLEIIYFRYTYILRQYQAGIHTIPFSYCVDISYKLARDIVESKALRVCEKIRLIANMREMYLQLQPYAEVQYGLKNKIYCKIQKFPPFFIYLCVNLYVSLYSALTK